MWDDERRAASGLCNGNDSQRIPPSALPRLASKKLSLTLTCSTSGGKVMDAAIEAAWPLPPSVVFF